MTGLNSTLCFMMLTSIFTLACEKPETKTPENPVQVVKQEASPSGLNIEVRSFTLQNGLKVALLQDDTLPTVNINVWYQVGAADDPRGKEGLANLFKNLLFAGSQNTSANYLAMAEMGGANINSTDVLASVNYDRIALSTSVPSSSLEYILWLESDRMRFLLDKVTEEILKNTVAIAKNEIKNANSQLFSNQSSLISQAMFEPTNPYSHNILGTYSSLDSITLEDVRNFYNAYFSPNNAVVSISGNFDKEAAEILVGKYFGPFQPSITKAKVVNDVPPLNTIKTIEYPVRYPFEKLTLTWPTPGLFSQDEPALNLIAKILGQNTDSRLNQKLIKTDGIADQLVAYLDLRQSSGFFHIEVYVNPSAKIEQVQAALEAELASIHENGFTEGELESAQAQHEYVFMSNLENIAGRDGKGNMISSYATYLGKASFFDQDLKRYQDVSTAALKTAFDKWIFQKNYTQILYTKDLSGRSNAAESDRTQVPSIAGDVSINIPALTKSTLSNGLDVYVFTRKGVPKIDATLLIKKGNLDETLENAGISHFTAMLVPFGTEDEDASKTKLELNRMGSRLSSEGTKFGSAVNLSTLTKNWSRSFGLFAQIIQKPAFPAEEIEPLKKAQINQLQTNKESAPKLASDLFPQILFSQKHPAGLPIDGSMESVQSFDRMKTQENYNNFWRPNNAALIIIGDISVEEAQKAAEKEFGAWEKGVIPPTKEVTGAIPQKPYIFLIDKQGSQLAEIRIGAPIHLRDSPEYYATNVLNGILGGTYSSKLNRNLIVDKRWTANAYSFVNSQTTFGYWTAQTSVPVTLAANAFVEMVKEIKSLSTAEEITDKELDDTKKSLARSYLQSFESLKKITSVVAPLINNGIDTDDMQKYISSLLAVSKEDVSAMATKYMDPDKTISLIIGDLSVIEPALLDLNLGEIFVLSEEGKVLRAAAKSP